MLPGGQRVPKFLKLRQLHKALGHRDLHSGVHDLGAGVEGFRRLGSRLKAALNLKPCMQRSWQTATLEFRLYGCSQSSTATACRGNGMKSTRATKVKSLKNWSYEQVCRKSSFWQGWTTMKTLCIRRLLHTLQLPVPEKIQKLAPKHYETMSHPQHETLSIVLAVSNMGPQNPGIRFAVRSSLSLLSTRY